MLSSHPELHVLPLLLHVLPLLFVAVLGCANKMDRLVVRASMVCCDNCLETAKLIHDDGQRQAVKACKTEGCSHNGLVAHDLCRQCYGYNRRQSMTVGVWVLAI